MTATSAPATRTVVSFTLNGHSARVECDTLDSLLRVLREQLDVTSPRVGCNEGSCGTCTVLLDGEPRRGCLLPAFVVEGREVTTLEGLGGLNNLHPLQRAFHEQFASQCGFCTSGMILTAKALLDRMAAPSRDEIVAALSGNLCRCTGYASIIRAIEAVAGTGGR